MSSSSGSVDQLLSRDKIRIFEITLFVFASLLTILAVGSWFWILMSLSSYVWNSYTDLQIIMLFGLSATGIVVITAVVGATIHSHRRWLLTKIVKFWKRYPGGFGYLFDFPDYKEEVGNNKSFFEDIHEDVISSGAPHFPLLSGELGALINGYSDPDYTKVFTICSKMRERDGKVTIITGRNKDRENSIVELITRIKDSATSSDEVAEEDLPLLIYETLDYLTSGVLQIIILNSRPSLHFSVFKDRLYIQQRHDSGTEKTVHWYLSNPPWYMIIEHKIRLGWYHLYAVWRDFLAKFLGGRYARLSSDPTIEVIRSIITRLENELSNYEEDDMRRRIGSAFLNESVLDLIDEGANEERIYRAIKEVLDENSRK